MDEQERKSPDARQRTEAYIATEQPDSTAHSSRLPFVVRWRIAIAGSALKSMQKLVAFTLSLYADSDGRNAFPSELALVEASSASERTVRDALRELGEAAWLIKEQRNGSGQGWRWNFYTLTIPEGAARPALPMRKGAERSAGPTNDERPAAGAGRASTSGSSVHKVRQLTPRGPASTAADLDLHLEKAPSLRARARDGVYPTDEARKRADGEARARAFAKLKAIP
jgi:hypothetical protein